MTLLALSENNIDFIKRGLKRSYPSSVKSSHLSEAIAASCGFRTNISLVTRVRAVGPRRPDLTEVHVGRFLARMAELGYPTLDGAVLPVLVRSQEMPERIWLVRKGRDIPLLNDWYQQCQQRDIPYVYITTRRKLAQVDWDCIAFEKRHEEVTSTEGGRDLFDTMLETFQSIMRGKPGKPIFDGSSFVGSIKDVPMELAPDLADAMYRILYEAIREGERWRS